VGRTKGQINGWYLSLRDDLLRIPASPPTPEDDKLEGLETTGDSKRECESLHDGGLVAKKYDSKELLFQRKAVPGRLSNGRFDRPTSL